MAKNEAASWRILHSHRFIKPNKRVIIRPDSLAIFVESKKAAHWHMGRHMGIEEVSSYPEDEGATVGDVIEPNDLYTLIPMHTIKIGDVALLNNELFIVVDMAYDDFHNFPYLMRDSRWSRWLAFTQPVFHNIELILRRLHILGRVWGLFEGGDLRQFPSESRCISESYPLWLLRLRISKRILSSRWFS